MNTAFALLLLELLAVATINISFCNGSSHVGCIESERQTLLQFKQGLKDPSNRLTSWIGDGDCCAWAGVVCDNFTGHILELHLGNPFNQIVSEAGDFADAEAFWRSRLVGNISPSLLDFKQLIYLDLSGNDFEEVQIPRFLGFMRNLRYLNLSQIGFRQMIPHQLGDLYNLQYLDLSRNLLEGPIFYELQNLTSLRYLDLSHNNFNSSIPNWLYKFSHLEYLSLSHNNLQGSISRSFERLCNLRFISLSHVNMTQEISEILDIFSGCISNKLESLDLRNNKLSGHLSNQFQPYINLDFLVLSGNSISGPIPSSLGDRSFLEILDLSHNKLSGPIPTSFGNISSIIILDLSHNELNDSIPSSLGKLLSLKELDLSNNKLNGPVPSSLGELSSLQVLDFSGNKLNDTLSQIHFANLTRLSRLDLSHNSIVFKVNSDWSPPFQLQTLYLRSCYLGPKFPAWIHSQKYLYYLDISNSGILDTIPNWFWKSSSQFTFLNLSHNQIHGEIPNLVEAKFRSSIDLSSNNLSGSLPRISSNVTRLDLSSNALSGSIFQFLCHGNESRDLKILYLKDNFLSGELSDCWMNWPNLIFLNLENNKFIGHLPISMGTLTGLQSLHLRKNSLSGTIPMSLKNCTELIVFDIGENEFGGNVPIWMGESFSSIRILNFRSNKFHGSLPSELCHLTYLQILDLAYNNLFGSIPRCISNFSAMVKVDYSTDNNIFHMVDFVGGVPEDELLVLKGQGIEYNNNLNLVRIIDLSNNNFSGEIPVEVTNLEALQSLNLSHNLFTGRIPDRIGVMRSLESFDFSSNQLSGEIPQSISDLTFLSYLNLSNNNLVGKIPASTQIQGFNASSFTGNELCGYPLPNDCTEIVTTPDYENGGELDGNKHEVNWFFVSMALGFVVGFWSFIGPLLVNKRWRYMYCSFLDHLGHKFCCAVRQCC